tara:strand:+ start:1812 stop:1961 length:150 start_codon:yes stop_codon:yes gene_type:complete
MNQTNNDTIRNNRQRAESEQRLDNIDRMLNEIIRQLGELKAKKAKTKEV